MLAAETSLIGVFGLFHPTELWVKPAPGHSLQAGNLRLEGGEIAKYRLGHTGSVRVTSSSGGAADFLLTVPGRFERRFRGVLTIRPDARELMASLEIDLEQAISAVVAAESVPGAPLEALKAQAVVARSFYTASPARHAYAAFCDTTHCQFLKELPDAASMAARAAETTRGLILTYDGQGFAALYSAACGGRTRSLGDTAGYPYFAVNCDYCRRDPNHTARGHRLGLCQQGAAGMAAQGATFSAILHHYYPATALALWPGGPSHTPSKFAKKQSTFIPGKVSFSTAAAFDSSLK